MSDKKTWLTFGVPVQHLSSANPTLAKHVFIHFILCTGSTVMLGQVLTSYFHLCGNNVSDGQVSTYFCPNSVLNPLYTRYRLNIKSYI